MIWWFYCFWTLCCHCWMVDKWSVIYSEADSVDIHSKGVLSFPLGDFWLTYYEWQFVCTWWSGVLPCPLNTRVDIIVITLMGSWIYQTQRMSNQGKGKYEEVGIIERVTCCLGKVQPQLWKCVFYFFATRFFFFYCPILRTTSLPPLYVVASTCMHVAVLQ